MTAKCKLITLPHVTLVHYYYARKKGRRKKKKERSGGNVLRHYKVYQESKAGGVVGDNSLTGPVVAGRLDETTRGKHNG